MYVNEKQEFKRNYINRSNIQSDTFWKTNRLKLKLERLLSFPTASFPQAIQLTQHTDLNWILHGCVCEHFTQWLQLSYISFFIFSILDSIQILVWNFWVKKNKQKCIFVYGVFRVLHFALGLWFFIFFLL